MPMTMIAGIASESAVFYFAELNAGTATDRAALVRARRYRLRPTLMPSLIPILALSRLANHAAHAVLFKTAPRFGKSS